MLYPPGNQRWCLIVYACPASRSVHPQYRWTFPAKGNAGSAVRELLVSGPDSSLRRGEQNNISADGGRGGTVPIFLGNSNFLSQFIDDRARCNNSTESSSLLAELTTSTNPSRNCCAIINKSFSLPSTVIRQTTALIRVWTSSGGCLAQTKIRALSRTTQR